MTTKTDDDFIRKATAASFIVGYQHATLLKAKEMFDQLGIKDINFNKAVKWIGKAINDTQYLGKPLPRMPS